MKITEALRKGKEVRRSWWGIDTRVYFNKSKVLIFENGYIKKEYSLNKEELFATDWEVYGEGFPLTEEEKAYLEGVLKPFKNKVKFIAKYTTLAEGQEYIDIKLKNDDECILPAFRPNKMYKGMELYVEYTLKELGLFKNEEEE